MGIWFFRFHFHLWAMGTSSFDCLLFLWVLREESNRGSREVKDLRGLTIWVCRALAWGLSPPTTTLAQWRAVSLANHFGFRQFNCFERRKQYEKLGVSEVWPSECAAPPDEDIAAYQHSSEVSLCLCQSLSLSSLSLSSVYLSFRFRLFACAMGLSFALLGS